MPIRRLPAKYREMTAPPTRQKNIHTIFQYVTGFLLFDLHEGHSATRPWPGFRMILVGPGKNGVICDNPWTLSYLYANDSNGNWEL